MKKRKKRKQTQLRLPLDGDGTKPPEPPVLDRARAHVVTERGIRQADDAARDGYRALLDDAVYRTARRCAELVSDDVWVELGTEQMRTGNPSALGAAMRRAARDGFIRLQAEREDSQRPTQHRKPLRVWKSCIYSEAPHD